MFPLGLNWVELIYSCVLGEAKGMLEKVSDTWQLLSSLRLGNKRTVDRIVV